MDFADMLYIMIVVVSLLLFPCTSFAKQQEATYSLRDAIQNMKHEVDKVRAESNEKIKALSDRIHELEGKLSVYDEKTLSKGSSHAMGDKEKIAYLAKHKNTPIGTYLGVMNPDISILVDTNTYFTRDKSRPDRNKVKVREGEVSLQGNVYPGIRGDFYATFEQEYQADGSVKGSVDLEAGTLTFMDLPLDLTAQVGRMFVEFGDMNKIHQHHRQTVDQPLVLEHFFGNHSWIDDGIKLQTLIPNPMDLFWKFEASYLNGRPLNLHDGEHEDENGEVEELPGESPIHFNDKIVMLRTMINYPFEDNSKDLDLSYSFAWQNKDTIKLHDIGLKFKYRFPYMRRSISWKSEAIFYDNKMLGIRSVGGYSQLTMNWNAYWGFGSRIDWSEFTETNKGHSKSASLFTTYHFTETTFSRIQYRYRQEPSSLKYNELFLQLVWGIGPHTHRLED